MRGMIRTEGKCDRKTNAHTENTNAHTLLQVECFNASMACFGPRWPIIRECKVAYNNLTFLSSAVHKKLTRSSMYDL
jgi:hypothetical protein